MAKRIGLLGGTFDPIHYGHLTIAEQCREVGNLEEIHFMPAAVPPHKLRLDMAGLEDRVAMIGLAIRDNPFFQLETIEAGRDGPSYTADTLRELKQRNPDMEIHFIMGADGVVDLPNWHLPRQILELCSLCIVHRPGFPAPDMVGLAHRLEIEFEAISQRVIPTVRSDVSSSDIRHRIATGKSVRYMVPDEVAKWIDERKLYSQPRLAGIAASNRRSSE